MSNLLDRLEQRKMPTTDVRICLDLELLHERDTAMRDVQRAYTENKRDQRMAGDSKALTDARAAVADVEQRIHDNSLLLRITGVDRLRYNQLMAQCPPQRGQNTPFDPTKFYMHVARHTAKYVDENGDIHDIDGKEWSAIDKAITDGEHDRIAKAVLEVNRTVGGEEIAFLDDASATTTDSVATSESPEASE